MRWIAIGCTAAHLVMFKLHSDWKDYATMSICRRNDAATLHEKQCIKHVALRLCKSTSLETKAGNADRDGRWG